jgi:hypothetical protein
MVLPSLDKFQGINVMESGCIITKTEIYISGNGEKTNFMDSEPTLIR